MKSHRPVPVSQCSLCCDFFLLHASIWLSVSPSYVPCGWLHIIYDSILSSPWLASHHARTSPFHLVDSATHNLSKDVKNVNLRLLHQASLEGCQLREPHFWFMMAAVISLLQQCS
ncbi:hypothetical protein LINGRAHAP2_LOCUS13906 [Linum grandiflorum]